MKTFYIVLVALAVLLVLYVAYSGVKLYLTVQVSKKLVHNAVPYQNITVDTSKPFLILGDSTAVGVGASEPDYTLGGRVAHAIGTTYAENHAVSGAVVADLPGQIYQAKLPHYHLILIQIGANDIIQFHNAAKTATQLQSILKTLPQADKVIIISAGDVGGATLFPIFIRPFHTWGNNAFNTAFTAATTAAGATYVNLTQDSSTKIISANPKKYLAADGLHPSDAGYALWFQAIQNELPK